MANRVALAYSGGLDTSAILTWLRETYDCEVVAFVADVGQGDEELVGIEEKALKSGAVACEVADLKREFIEEYVFPTLIAGAVYEGRYLLGTAMARPVIAKAQVEAARKHGCDAVAHGCTGKGNDQVRFDSCFSALAPDLEVIAPWRQKNWKFKSREDLLEYVRERGIPVTASAEKIYSRDRNLWHISHEGGAIEDAWNPPPEDAWMLTASIAETPDEHLDVSLSFEHGRPVALDGERMAGEKLVEKLNALAGPHGVGRVDIIENRVVGMKSRGLYETPGGTVIKEALSALEELVLDREAFRAKERSALEFARLVYEGRWFTPLRAALMAQSETLAEPLTGEVVVRLFKGHATPIRRKSPNALYSEDYATFGPDEVYDQSHAEGFIRLLSLPERIRAYAQQKAEKLDKPGINL